MTKIGTVWVIGFFVVFCLGYLCSAAGKPPVRIDPGITLQVRYNDAVLEGTVVSVEYVADKEYSGSVNRKDDSGVVVIELDVTPAEQPPAT